MTSLHSQATIGNESYPLPPNWVVETLRAGIAIPAHPLALTDQLKLDDRKQRGLSRYYHAAGAKGLAVGVHTTQFEIRQPKHALLQPVLELAQETIVDCDERQGRKTVLIAGICGCERQAIEEARLARELGYHLGMVSLSALSNLDDQALVEHCRAIAHEIPIFGFYMQTAVGGRKLSVDFWRSLALIPNLIGIKIAPFDRYKTLDVLQAVTESGRGDKIVLYTGNDDNIVLDLLTKYTFFYEGRMESLRIVGGLLGHWACWTKRAVELLDTCKKTWDQQTVASDLLTLAGQVTDCNAALFDAKNNFHGCIPGVHYVLQQQGLLANLHCLDPKVGLSLGQREEINRVRASYPHLIDDAFVQENIDTWLT
ncbi:dihydrodipicolinate synthase family protein [Blastopirellula sp. J2-11]|uniref:dihydrodipicolinate synthase family protein n=1 Tax=Blastopirellula sp. J2-11 TaxID=2943192 RepID=UPI0021C8380B|nr:dihydrodipicolinate synthase family protein [Blastopirellula sp. J2-11]UUO04383.1 dihydrodipicolinate synthase family protein [Blastopirellula sp. J2-11]